MLKHRLTFYTILILGLFLIISLARSSLDLYGKKDILIERKLAVKKAELENERLKQELETAKSEEYIEEVARNKLGLGKPGETIVILDDADIRYSILDIRDEAGESDLPNWQKWLRLFVPTGGFEPPNLSLMKRLLYR